VEHGQLVTKGENLDLQGGAGPKTGGEESSKSNQNRVHRGCNHHRTNDDNLCVFKSDRVSVPTVKMFPYALVNSSTMRSVLCPMGPAAIRFTTSS
jgi:hypothetical protein